MPDELPDEDTVAAGAVANAAQYLKGLTFPARKQDVLERAQENGADESAIAEIRKLPDARAYDNAMDVIDALGDEVRMMRLD